MSLVAYITRKVFADGSDEIRIKHNPEITVTTIENARKSRAKNKIKREQRKIELERKLLKISLLDSNYARERRIIEHELQLRNIQNITRSAYRSRQNLYDICRCNDFQYFVTWTFDQEKIDRLNDKAVKRKFTQFQNYLRKKFPNMYYVAVPEYHKKGGLHFHLLIGGVTMEELKAVPAVYTKSKGRHKKGDLIFKNGKQIFNVTRWKLGYSTLSKVANGEAAKHYICKYITKQHYDDRFFGKRRYYVSNNIKRPEIEKYCTTPERCLDKINLDVYLISFADISKKFAVFTSDGNGILNVGQNSEQSRKNVQRLCTWTGGAASASPCAAAPSGACPYSTLRTLDSTSSVKLDWKKLKKRFNNILHKTLKRFYAEQHKTPEEICREIGLID